MLIITFSIVENCWIVETCLCLLSQAQEPSVLSGVHQVCTNYNSIHKLKSLLSACTYLYGCLLTGERQTEVSHPFLFPIIPVCCRKISRGAELEKWVFFFVFFSRCKFLPPTGSKRFCLPDKCARGKKTKKKTKHCTQQHHAHQQNLLPRGVGEEKTKLHLRHTLYFHHH